MLKGTGFSLAILFTLFFGCKKIDLIDPPGIEVAVEADSFVFAVIGDYGLAGEDEQSVAELVKSWSPDFIITTGDNNYQNGEMESIKENISAYYGEYIYNYDAEEAYRCEGKANDEKLNRFFPSPGNHDSYSINGLKPYLNFFTLPGKEEYYSFCWGDIAFYSLNSTASFIGEQEEWLKEELVNSTKKINIVYFHHSPFSTGKHGNEKKMQLDYYGMGVNIVFTGHDHIYSRIEKEGEEGLYYVVNGAGGKTLYQCGASPLDEEIFSVSCYDVDFGAVKGVYDGAVLKIEFYAVGDQLSAVDSFEIFPSR